MTDAEHYDTLIIGSGQAAGPLATAMVAAGRRTALIERAYVGGTCINYGCTPTKTMAASAEVAYIDAHSKGYGIEVKGETIDMSVVRQRKRDMVTNFRESSQKQIVAGDVDLIMGNARFTGPKTLTVALNDSGTRELTADIILIDVGGRPSAPPIAGLDGVPSLDSTTIMELDVVPDHLVILGGGYIGVEFAQMFRRFGSRVTIVERAPQLLSQEDADVAAEVTKILREDGIEVLLGCTAERVSKAGSSIQLTVKTEVGERSIEGSHLLVAIGRKPNSDELNLQSAGIETNDHGFITVDERLQTSAEAVYAAGDVTGGPPFTHIAYDDFRILRDNLLHNGTRTTTGRQVPYTVFIDPQLGRVGMTEREARKQHKNIKVAVLPMSSVARAIETDRTRGMMKAIVDADTEQIVGCAILGMEGGEIMAMIQIAMLGKVTYKELAQGIFAHPTLAEGVNSLFDSIE